MLLFVGALGLQATRERAFALASLPDDTIYVTSGRAIGRAVLSFDALAADVYWIRTIQHYGDTRLLKGLNSRYPLLRPLLDLTTSLDPHFMVAYRFGAIFLAEGPPDGPGRPDWALALLQKGLEANPQRWELVMDTGFVHYWWLQDYKVAAQWFDRAARVPGGPWWLKSMAAVTLAEGGDRQASRQMWRQIRETADHEWLRNNASLRLAQFDALDQIDQLAAIVARFVAATGRFPHSWQSLVDGGWLRAVPLDPGGTAYELNARIPGGVGLAASSPLQPLPPQLVKKASPTQ
jgi:hypothetical protein